MNNIIEFPGGKKRIRRETVNYVAESIDLQGNPPNSKFDFTCVNCNNQTQLQIDNAIFKNVELFCSKCGSGWKITNPMFAAKRARSG